MDGDDYYMKVYRNLFRDLLARLGWRFPTVLALMALVGLSEGASIALLLPLLNRIGVQSAGSQGLATAMLERGLQLTGIDATDPVAILVAIIAVSTVQTALFIILHWWCGKLARRYQSQRQSELFRAFMRARWVFVAARKSGELTNVIVTECERLGMAFTLSLSIISALVVVLIYVCISILIAWPVTLSLIAFALLSGLPMMGLYRKSYSAGQTLAPLNAELQSVLGEQFSGFKIIKATASEDRASARIDPLVQKLEKANAFVSFLPAMVRGLLEFLALVGLSTMFVLGSKGLGVAPGNVLVVLALFARLFPRITTLQANLHYLNGYIHAYDAINQLQSDAEAEAERQDSLTESIKVNLPTRLLVQNLDVKFGEHKVLDKINMAMTVPGMLGIVGGSGAGKSTLVHTLLGLVEPSAGSIRLGEYELSLAPLGAWRRAIGYVPQETILFHASVRENLTLANPSASQAEVELAVRRAHADDFIEALPEGYNTVIGDQGVKLSGGQRQRLGIARALLTNPVLLALDEAMSALDAESEAELSKTLEELRKQMGILIIAHRLGAVRTADSIYVFEAGRVVESGNWNELMARKSRLFSLAEAQSLGHDRSVEALQSRAAAIGN
jgi:ATP-binding cassette subfamily C protein